MFNLEQFCEIPRRFERGTKRSLKGCGNLSLTDVFQNRGLTVICNGPKRTISASGRLALLQIISEPDTRQCASEDVRPLKGVNCEVPHRLERGMKHSLEMCGNLSLTYVF